MQLSSPPTSHNSTTPKPVRPTITPPLPHSHPSNVSSAAETAARPPSGRAHRRSATMTWRRSPICGNGTASRPSRGPGDSRTGDRHLSGKTRVRKVPISMSEGYVRIQCRGCDLLVYEGPWIAPRERHLLHDDHRNVCSSTGIRPCAPTTTTASVVSGPPALLLLASSDHREPASSHRREHSPRERESVTALPREA